MKAAIICANGFQDEELIYPYYRMLEEGYEVTVATITGEPVRGKYGVPTKGAHIKTILLHEPNFDMVFVPGGDESPDRLRTRPEVKVFIQAMDRAGKLIAAICHGPWVLISAKILRGRRATCISYMADDMENCGAIYVNAPVVRDGHIITAPHYRNNSDLMREVIAWSKQ